ncbi:MAG: flagellar basal body rod protein FlgB, partial [Gammaproteobacteria bacterium]|nr:flagellar basal body rod protein FlgB [Gammaproteobacteria bacterium]
MAFNIDKLFGIHQHAVGLRSQRAGLLAANLANSDTPNYKARDLDFQAELEKARGKSQGAGIRTTHPNHISGANNSFSTDVIYRKPSQPSLDGNTVETHIEHAAFMDNALKYQASIQFLSGNIKGMM